MSVSTRGRRTHGKAPEILQVFTRKVAEFGYDGTNFSDIAQELGISKGTIVHHYGTKDRLLATLHESYMRRRLQEARLLLDRLRTPAERLAGLLFVFMIYQQHDRDATVAFQRETVRLAECNSDEGLKLRAEYLALVRAQIADGVEAGQFRPVDVAVQSLLMFGAAQWAYTWFDPEGAESADEVGAALANLVLGSLLIRKTRLAELANPQGDVARTVRQCLIDASESGLQAS